MYFVEHTYTGTHFYLNLCFNKASCILSGNPIVSKNI